MRDVVFGGLREERMTEVRCIAPAREPRFKGDRCNGIVTREPTGTRYRVLGLVGHTSLADAGSHVFACKLCGHWHEVAIEAVRIALDSAA
jgi:hypothetical protein